MTELNVYVPAPDSSLRRELIPGSAVVSNRRDPDREQVLVDYEGNRYGAINMQRYEEKVLHAAGRHVEKYPTIARRFVPIADLIQIGTYDYDTQNLTITNQTELDTWSNQ